MDTLTLFIKNLLFTLFIPGVVTVVGPCLLIPITPSPLEFNLGYLRTVGFVLIPIGAGIYLSTIFDFAAIGSGTPAPFDPPRVLVIKGLYKYVRNPMYIGVLSVLLGEMIYFESAVLAAYIVFVFLSVNAFVIFYEEPTLETKFGDSYLDYKRSVPRWLPKGLKAE